MHKNQPITVKSKNFNGVQTNNYALNCACHICYKNRPRERKTNLEKIRKFPKKFLKFVKF